ncbi:MAG: DUF3830 family protein [Acidobacteriota bacterium]
MARYIEITLTKRNVKCVARLLDEEAPRTCEAVWQGLPQEGDVFHAKYASNEIYILVPTFAGTEPGPENRTLVPSIGDILYFHLPLGAKLPKEAASLGSSPQGAVDLAVFYDRNNLLLSPSEGFIPGNLFARIVRNLEAMKQAGNSVWREGAVGERLSYRKLEGPALKAWGLETD